MKLDCELIPFIQCISSAHFEMYTLHSTLFTCHILAPGSKSLSSDFKAVLGQIQSRSESCGLCNINDKGYDLTLCRVESDRGTLGPGTLNLL